MPDLPEVTQRFEADVAPYIEALERAAAAAREFAEDNAVALAAARRLSDAANDAAGAEVRLALVQRDVADASADLMMQTALLASMDERLASIQRDVADSSADLIMMNELLRGSFDGVDGSIDDVIGHLAALRAAQSSAAADTARSTGLMLGRWRLTGTAIHWIISGTAEILAVALPAAIAASVGAFVMYQGVVEQVGFRLESLYGATEATASMMHKTTGDVLGLGHAFQTAQNQANPVAYELLGEYINGAKSNMTDFAQAGLEVARMIGVLGAKMDVDLSTNAARFAGLIQDMVPDLQKFGQILGNIGHALLNFASDMPGLAEFLLGTLDDISKLILALSGLPHYLILVAFAFEEFQRWGGLLSSGLGKMSLAIGDTSQKWYTLGHAAGILKNAFGLLPALFGKVGSSLAKIGGDNAVSNTLNKIGTGMKNVSSSTESAIKSMGTFSTIGVAAIIAGITFLVIKLATAKTAAQQFTDSLQKMTQSVSNVNVVSQIAANLGQLQQKIIDTRVATDALTTSTEANLKTDIDQDKVMHSLNEQQRLAGQSISQFNKGQQQQLTDLRNVNAGTLQLSKTYGTDFAQGLALADVANVKLAKGITGSGQAAQIARMQIAGLVQGFKAMDQTGGTLGQDMNVLAIQTGLADTKVQQLNSAWDQFISNSTSVTSGLAEMNQDLTQIGNVGVAVGKKFETFSGTTKVSVNDAADAMKSFSGTGAQVWQNFNAGVSQAEQLMDSYRTAAAYGAISTRQFNGVIANTVGSLLPFAAHSKIAVSELSALAQEAGGPSTDSFKQLKAWVEASGISAKQFSKDVGDMTSQMSDAGKAAEEFASTLQSQMQAALAAVVLKGSNANQIMQNFQTAVEDSGGAISSHSSQYQALYHLLREAGLGAQAARDEIKEMQAQIDSLHGKKVPISVDISVNGDVGVLKYAAGGGATYTIGPSGPVGHGGQHGMTVGFAGGGMVGGGPGMDTLHALLTAGEAVLTAQAVSALGGPLAVHQLNNQPSHAVLSAGGGGGGGAVALNQRVDVMLNGSKISSTWRQELLVYNRRNPNANTRLRVR
jgi:hypothetical protein